jgi:hypothetical protein
MRLLRIRPEDDHYRGTFICETCGRIRRGGVKLGSALSPPLAPEQPQAHAPSHRPALGLFAWRRKRKPSSPVD